MSTDDRHVCVARLDGVERFFLWESGENSPDAVVVDDDGSILMFASEDTARASPGVSSEEPAVYDLDTIEAWCASDDPSGACKPLLGAWNLLVDLPHDDNLFTQADTRARDIYDKLFHGCNLPAMTPADAHYVPTWTDSETAVLKHVLRLGLAELRARLR